MARSLRTLPLNRPAHIVNRGNDRRTIFAHRDIYLEFIRLLAVGKRRYAVSVEAYCLMPNHFHVVLVPKEEDAISAYLHWVSGCFACYLRQTTGTRGTGHVFQHRFWSSVVNDPFHYLAVVRYVEANPLRAKLVEHAEDWEWGSLRERLHPPRRRFLGAPWVELPDDWVYWVNSLQSQAELQRIRRPRRPGRPKKTPDPISARRVEGRK